MADSILNFHGIEMKVLDLDPTPLGLVEQLKKEMPCYVTLQFTTEDVISYESGYLQEINDFYVKLWSNRKDNDCATSYLTGAVIFGKK